MPVEMFMEFVDRKQRQAKRHLKIIEQLLTKNGLSATGHFEEDEPFVYLKNSNPKMSFEGVRIYEIGNIIAYRVSKEEKTEPYGKAYQLNLEEMFNDLMGEADTKEEEAAQKVIAGVVQELKSFFDKSAKAEVENKAPLDGLMLRTGGSDYSSLVFNKG